MKIMREFLRQAWLLYYDGFRNMTVGKTLWVLIAVKLVIVFAVIKLLFFPSFLGGMDQSERADYVTNELITR